jgi:hypothetical protein
MLGIKPRGSYTLGKCFTIELQPQPCNIVSQQCKEILQVEYALSKMLGTRSVSDFSVLQILEYLHKLYYLSILNPKI